MEPVIFELHHGQTASEVVEAGSTRALSFYVRTLAAERTCAYLNKEHAKGRVAQGKCRNGGADCDWERINEPRLVSTEIILCEVHGAAFDKARGRAA